MYTPELSKKNGKIAEPRQMKGIGWVAAKAKARFEERHWELLARWGRTPGDGDACLLLPADWTSLEPTEIIELMKTKKFPNGSESRVVRRPPPGSHHTKFIPIEIQPQRLRHAAFSRPGLVQRVAPERCAARQPRRLQRI